MEKVCVECGSHVPVYLNYLCEDCYGTFLNEKFMEEKENEE